MKFVENKLVSLLKLKEQEYLKLDEALINLGYEIESKEKNANVKGVKLAYVLEARKHPNADKLKFCLLDSDGEKYDVICGGKNISQGQWVVYAPPGSFVQKMTLAKKVIRGIESAGMVLSIPEILGISEKYVEDINQDNILELPVKIVEDLLDHNKIIKALDIDKHFYDISVLNDRKYANSYYLLAKEIQAYFKKEFILPTLSYKTDKTTPKINFDLKLNALGIYSSKVKIKSSETPLEIKLLLYKHNFKPQNNISDLIAYVSLLTGNTIYYLEDQKHLILNKNHLNDLNLFHADVLNNKTNEGMLVALASDYHETMVGKKDINAFFGPMHIRGTNNYLLKYSLELLLTLGQKYGFIEQTSEIIGKENNLNKQITLKDQDIFNYIGVKVDLESSKEKLELLDFKIDDGQYKIPNYRLDIESKEDLIEEIIRLYGINNIKAKEYPIGKKAQFEPNKEMIKKITYLMSKYNFHETKTYHLITNEDAKRFNFWKNNSLILLEDKYNFKFNTLRTSLLKSLLEVHVYNYRNEEKELNFFEISNVNINDKNYIHLGLIFDEEYYSKEPVLILKKLFYEVWNSLDLDSSRIKFFGLDNQNFNPYLSSKVLFNDGQIAIMGELSPQILRENKYIRLDKIKSKLYYLEMRLLAK